MFSVQRYWAVGLDRIRTLRRLRLQEKYNREARGLTLLKEWLSDEQREQFEAKNYFDVIGSDSGKRYRIRYGSAANIYEIDEAHRAINGWCFVPNEHLVPGDVMLAQKIALETNEDAALAVANKF